MHVARLKRIFGLTSRDEYRAILGNYPFLPGHCVPKVFGYEEETLVSVPIIKPERFIYSGSDSAIDLLCRKAKGVELQRRQ